MQLFVVFIVALSITAVLIPPLARLAPSLGLTDQPGPRKVHVTRVPRVGGLAMAAGMLCAILLAVEIVPAIAGLLAGLLVLLAFGVWDDRVELGYRPKLLGQVIAAAVVIGIGDVRIDTLSLGSRVLIPEAVSLPMTLLFLVGVTNAMNLSDGLDGLAGGMSLLCLSALALLGAASGNPHVTATALIAAGAIFGFLRFNTHPARVFMGDAGSQILGFTLGVLAILATQDEGSPVSASLPLLLLGVPIIDTILVMVGRLRDGRSPFSSDRTHLHHRLLGLGFSHRGAVATIYAAQCASVLLAYFLRFESDLLIVSTFLAFGAGLAGLLVLAESRGWQLHAVAPSAAARALSSRALPAAVPLAFAGLVTYAAVVVATSAPIGPDLMVLCIAMLAAMLVLMALRNSEIAAWGDRPIAYVVCVLLVYLDQNATGHAPYMEVVSWGLIAISAAAAVVPFLTSTTRRFEATSLDFLVIFIAIVVPNLPSGVAVPATLPVGIAKAMVLLYSVEMLMSIHADRRALRVGLALLVALLVLRAVPGV